MDHAVLSFSSSKRWLTCTRSPRAEQEFPDTESDAAREGTLAHSIAEAMLKGFQKTGVTLLDLSEWQFFKEQEFYNEAMLQHSEDFALYVTSFYEEGDVLSVEQRLDLSKWAPESFGHCDANILQVAKKHLHIFDYKFGKGVEVIAKDNTQLMGYALGVIELLDWLGYEIEKVTMHIYQPRIFNENPPFTMLLPDLFYWGRYTLRPRAELAFAGEGEFVPGEHCFFCKAKPRCRALAEYNLELAKHDFTDPSFLNDQELIDVFEKKRLFEAWMKSVSEYALSEALQGKKWPGYKLVEGKSDRAIKDEGRLIASLTELFKKPAQLEKLYKPKSLLGITELTKKLGTGNFNTYVGPFLYKPPGAPTLAPEDDDRPVYNKAALDFKDDWVDPDDWENL